MELLVIYLIGWTVFSISYYVYEVYGHENVWPTKKYIAYNAFKHGIASWFGIIVVLAGVIVYYISKLDEYIEEKLSN